jgi:ADP-heptose:LPS heptosyltransferase
MSKILAVRLSSLGDVVLSQPVLTALAAAGHAVELLTKPAYRTLAEMFPGVARVLADPAEGSAYDLVLDWHGTLRARTWIGRIKRTRTVHYAKHGLARRLLIHPGGRPVFWNAWSPLTPAAAVTQWYAQAARRAGLTLALGEPRLDIPPAARQDATALLASAGLAKQESWVAMAPGAKWPTKQWPVEFYAALAAKLEKERGLRTIFLGAGEDAGVCRAAQALAGPRAISLAGLTNAPVLAALLAQARLLVSNDSGPLHLGLAAGACVLAFFGPTVKAFGFAPPDSPRVRVLERVLPCRPCALHGSRRCPLGHHHCLTQITADDAFAAALALLG